MRSVARRPTKRCEQLAKAGSGPRLGRRKSLLDEAGWITEAIQQQTRIMKGASCWRVFRSMLTIHLSVVYVVHLEVYDEVIVFNDRVDENSDVEAKRDESVLMALLVFVRP